MVFGDFLSGFIQFMTDLKVFWDCFLEMFDGFWRFSQWIYPIYDGFKGFLGLFFGDV